MNRCICSLCLLHIYLNLQFLIGLAHSSFPNHGLFTKQSLQPVRSCRLIFSYFTFLRGSRIQPYASITNLEDRKFQVKFLLFQTSRFQYSYRTWFDFRVAPSKPSGILTPYRTMQQRAVLTRHVTVSSSGTCGLCLDLVMPRAAYVISHPPHLMELALPPTATRPVAELVFDIVPGILTVR